MVYAYLQDVPIGPELYEKIIDEIGPKPPAGSLLHLCVWRPDGGLRYIDAWESEQACTGALDERMHPAVDRAFGSGEPVVQRLTSSRAESRLPREDER